MKEVHWTDRAKARLKNIETYLTEKASPKIAKQEVAKILRRSQKLSSPPDTGHKIKGYEATPLREVLIRPYRISTFLKKAKLTSLP